MSLEQVLTKYGATEVAPVEAYKQIFHANMGYGQYNEEAPGKYKSNPLCYFKNDGDKYGHYRILFDDMYEDVLLEAREYDFAIISGCSYFGRKNVQAHASKLHAFILDLDGVTDVGLDRFLHGASVTDYFIYPMPNYLALSGHGVHLYYYLDEPLDLFPEIKLRAKELKYGLIKKIWNSNVSTIKAPQYQGINQGFRIFGGKCKSDAPRKFVKVYQLSLTPWTVRDLCNYVPEESQFTLDDRFRPGRLSLSEAQRLYPEWYERVVVQKKKDTERWKLEDKVHGQDPYALYHWWLNKIYKEATYGHRYFAVMVLAIDAMQCGYPLDMLRKDCEENLIDFLTALKPDYPFTKEDLESALECYDQRYCTFPVLEKEKLSNIAIRKNKRNGRKRSVHINYMNVQRSFKVAIGECTNGGRPDKKKIVVDWRQSHPNGTKADCRRDTKLDSKTIRKWWCG